MKPETFKHIFLTPGMTLIAIVFIVIDFATFGFIEWLGNRFDSNSRMEFLFPLFLVISFFTSIFIYLVAASLIITLIY